MSYIVPGTPRIALWTGGAGIGSKVSTWYLPAPDNKGGLKLAWVQKGWWPELIDGSESARVLGWLPELSLTWSAYNDVLPLYGTIGSASGDVLDINSLLAVLDNPASNLEVSPGPSAGGLFPAKITVNPLGIVANGIAAGLKLTFRSGAIYQQKILPAF